MKGWGKVFSRPTMSPTSLDILAHHLLPVGPVVGPSGPEVEAGAHTFLLEEGARPAGLGDGRVLLSACDHLLLLIAPRPQEGSIAEPLQEGQRDDDVGLA